MRVMRRMAPTTDPTIIPVRAAVDSPVPTVGVLVAIGVTDTMMKPAC